MMKWIKRVILKLAWEWREENKLLVKELKKQIKKLPNEEKKILNKIIDSAEKLVEMFFNTELYGFYFIKSHTKEMSMAKFRKVYSAIFAYYLFLVQMKKFYKSDYFNLLSEILTLDKHIFLKSLSTFENFTDIVELSRKAWSIIAEIIEYDETNAIPGIACGTFVIFSKAEWQKIEKLL